MSANADDLDRKYGDFLGSEQAGSPLGANSAPAASDLDRKYGAFLEREASDRKRQLGVVQGAAKKYQPDQFAEAVKLGDEFGVSPKIVADNPERYRTESARRAAEKSLSDTPATRQWMSDLDNAAVAQDDVDNIAGLERSIGKVGLGTRAADLARSVPGGLYGGLVGTALSGLGGLYGAGERYFGKAVETGLRAVGADPVADFLTAPRDIPLALNPEAVLLRAGREASAIGQAISPPVERQNLGTDIGGGLGQIIGQIAAVISLGPAAGTVLLAGQGAGQQVQRAEAAGATQEEIDQAAQVGALVTAVTERYQLDRLLNRVPAQVKGQILERLVDVAKAAGGEALQEVIEGIGQNLTAKAIYEPDAEVFEGLGREALAAGGAGGIARAVINAMVPGRTRQQGERDGASAAEIIDIVAQSKLAQRSPEKLEALVAAVKGQTGAEFAYVDPAAFRTLYQSDEEANAAANELTGGQNTYFEAALSGAPIALPIEKFVARVAPKAGQVEGKPFADFVTFTPDGVSASEAAASRETIDAQASEIAEREMVEARPDPSDAVYEDVFGQLISTGMERSTAEKNAKLTQSVFRSLASRSGLDAKALYNRYGLRIRRELPDVLASVPQIDLALDPLLDRLRTGDVPTQADAFGPSLLEFVRSLGGLKDERGELAGRDIDKANRPFERNVLQPNGRSLDDVAEVMVEAGYMTERDPNALLDLIDQELRGEPVFAFGNQKQDVIATREYLMQLQEDLGRRGVDLKQTSNLEARRILSQRQFDQRGEAKRGAITFGADRQFTISLFEKADLSTFLHESGHFYLEILGDLSEDANAPQQIKDDFAALLKWFGVKDRASIGTEQHEQFARGFEAYLMEGKSPSPELATVFDRFRAWLIGVYRTLARLNVTLNDEVRGVMDRIVATDEQIKAAEQDQAYAPVFLNAQDAGMSEAEWDAYRGVVDRAHRESVNELTGRAMNELARERKSWWKEERAKVEVEVTAEVEALPAYRALAILTSGTLPDGSELTGKLSREDLKSRYGSEFAKRVPRSATSSQGISTELMAQLLGFTDADSLVKAIVTARPRKELIKAETDARMRERYGDMLTDGTLVEEAITAVHTEARAKVLAAELRALKRKRAEVKPFVDAAAETARQQQREARDANYGNLLSRQEIADLREQAGLQIALNPGANPDGYAKLADRASKKAFDYASDGKFEDAAQARRMEVLNRELYYAAIEAQEKATRDAARKKVTDARASRDANAATLPDREELQALKLAATRAISAKKIGEIQPALYRRAEAKAARAAFDAAAKGDFETAYSEKRRQIYNYELFRAAVSARETIDKNVDYMRRFAKKSVREKLAAAKGQYLQQIDALRSRFDFTQQPADADLKRDRLNKWVDEQIAAGREVTIPQWILDEAKRTPYKSLLAIELDGIVDAAKNIEHLAKTKDRLLRNRKEADFKAAKAELDARARASLKGGKAPPVSQFEEGQFKRFGRLVADFGNSLRRTETAVEWLDDGESGPWHDFFMEPANNAEYARETLRTKILEPMRKLASTINRERRMELEQKIRIEALKQSFDRRTLISIVLNMGNASNLERLLDGGFRDVTRGNRISKFTPQALEQIKDGLNQKDWQFIQQAWDTAESMWPEMKAFQERMGGLVPEKIPATPVATKFGTFAGGYWPAVYDSLASKAGAKQADSADALGILMGANFTKASTGKSALKERTGAAGPLKLDFSAVMGRHIDQVITDITHREFAIQAMRILDDPDLKLTLQDTIGEVGWHSMRGMVASSIQQDGGLGDLATGSIDTMRRRLISNLAVAALGLKVTTAFGNLVLAPIQAAARISPKHIFKGIGQFMRHPIQARAFVDEHSEMMRNRAQNLDATFTVIREQLDGRTSILAKTQRFAMAIHRASDYVGTTGLWLGRYNQALDEGADHAEAARLADKAIRQTQTAGAPKDLSAFERNPAYRELKLFIGPMIIMGNRMREAAAGLRGQKRGAVKSWPEALGVMMAVWFLPAIIWDLVNGRGPDDDDDDGDVLTDEGLPWAFRKLLFYPFMTVPFLRDAMSLAERKITNSSAEARMTPAADAVWLAYQAGSTAAKQLSEDDPDDEDDARKITKAGLQAIGPLVGLPTNQLDITGSYLWDVYSGEYEPEGVDDLRYLLMRRPK